MINTIKMVPETIQVICILVRDNPSPIMEGFTWTTPFGENVKKISKSFIINCRKVINVKKKLN